MQPEAVSTQTSEVAQEATAPRDPVLLGVSLPLSLTVAAAAQVRTAWSSALAAVLTAARAKAAARAKPGESVRQDN